MSILKRGFAVLQATEGGDGSAGGGAGGDQSKGAGGTGGDNDPPKHLTEDDIGRIANQAITSHFKRLNLEGKISDAIGGLKLDEKFSALTESLKSFQQPKPVDPPKGGDKPAVDPEIAKQLQKLSEDLDREKTARAAAVAEAANTKREHEFGAARQRLYETLKPHAIESLHDVWVDNLIHHKRLKVEDGAQYLEIEHIPFPGSPKQKEFLPLDEAVRVLVNSDEAKRFLPPPDGGDASRGNPGPRNVRRGPGAPSMDSKVPYDRVAARLAALGLDADKEFG